MPPSLARWMPGSLAMRIFLVLLGGILLAAALTFGIAQQDRRQVIAHFHARETAQRVSDLLNLLAMLPTGQRRQALDELSRAEWHFASPERCDGRAAPHFAIELRDRLSDRVVIEDTLRFGPRMDDRPLPGSGPGTGMGRGMEAGPQHRPSLAVRGRFADGEAFCIVHEAPRRVPAPIEQWRFPASLALFVALIALVCWLAVRLALRPLQRMATAAETFGRDIHRPPLDTSGPTEVGQAAQAFNVMQDRVREAMAERTRILAAVTHDLKTPLTRMRLRLEACADSGLREKLGGDLDAMQGLVNEGLELARSLDTSETAARVDIGALLASIADDAADAGQAVTYEGPTGVLAECRPNSLRRAIENLVDNALKYGGGQAIVRLDTAEGRPCLRILDDGPGIPDDKLDEVLRPFVRLEASRSRESGGTGLGLAIAANLVAAQGGRLILSNRPEGGLEARIELPPPRS